MELPIHSTGLTLTANFFSLDARQSQTPTSKKATKSWLLRIVSPNLAKEHVWSQRMELDVDVDVKCWSHVRT